MNPCVVAASARPCSLPPRTGHVPTRASSPIDQDWARAQGFASMRVRSNVIRERAHRFYEREGYARIKAQAVFRKPLAAE